MINDSKNNKKILIVEVVEDETSLRKALGDKLVREGFTMLEAQNGEEGLATALRERPDLILLDIVMPKMDGLTMMKKLRGENEWGKNVPIILLTNLSADSEEMNKAITDCGPAYFLVKSNWTMSELLEKIKERLARQ